MRLTPRDIAVIHAVHEHRALRRDQIQRLLFPSKNTANARLQRLHAYRFLARRRLPVEYGQGSGQALYMLAGRGAQIVAEDLGVDVAEIGWKRSQNHVSSMFLEHTLMINDIRTALTLAAGDRARAIGRWLREDQLKADPDRVWIETALDLTEPRPTWRRVGPTAPGSDRSLELPDSHRSGRWCRSRRPLR